MSDALDERVRTLVSQIMKVKPAEVETASPATVQAWDSLRHMKLVLALEEEFGIAFAEDDIVQLIAFPKIVSIVRGLQANG